MENFKGTKGEWYNPQFGAEIISMPSQIKIGRVYVVSQDPEYKDMHANARLIAAAPDLLKALQDFTEDYIAMVESGDCGNWDPNKEDVVINAKKAIHKALNK